MLQINRTIIYPDCVPCDIPVRCENFIISRPFSGQYICTQRGESPNSSLLYRRCIIIGSQSATRRVCSLLRIFCPFLCYRKSINLSTSARLIVPCVPVCRNFLPRITPNAVAINTRAWSRTRRTHTPVATTQTAYKEVDTCTRTSQEQRRRQLGGHLASR